ncbi:MAG: hypothetical protein ABIP55_03540 [Tepidisphaeraceae bacterium]
MSDAAFHPPNQPRLRSLLGALLLLFLMQAGARGAETLAGTRMAIDWPRLISAHDIALTAPPADSYQGLLLGNGDVAVSLFGPPQLLTLHLGKNDLWDYRDPMDEKRPVTHAAFLAKYADPSKPPLANYLSDPAVDAHNVDIRQTYETPMPSSKPAGQIRFRTKPRAGKSVSDTNPADTTYQAKLHLWDAEVVAGTGPGKPALRAFVPYPHNLIAAVFDAGDSPSFDIELARHKDITGSIAAVPKLGARGRDMWVRYAFPADPVTYPKGFEYVMYARVLGGEVEIEVIEKFATIVQATWRLGTASTQPVAAVESACVAHVRSAGPVTLMVAVVTTRDDPHPFGKARQEVDDAEKQGLAELERAHRGWWHDFWKRSFVELSGRTFLNKQWYFSQYLLACSQRAGRVAPGLFGAWAWEDYPLFGNDYHWDYNMQQAIWGAFSSNHLEHVVPYEDAALSLLPAAITDARDTYGIDGAKFFLTSYPRTYRHNPFPLLHYDKMMSLNGWVAHPLWWKYLYSQDQEYLRTRAYPLMRECARFYEAYLSRTPDGKYEIWPTAAWDVDFTPHLKFNRNFPMDLSFVKDLLRACATASEVLGVDGELRGRWRDIADDLKDYPTADSPAGKVFSAYQGAAAGYHFPLETMMIFPGDCLGLHTPGPMRDIALRTLAPMTYHGDEQLLKAVMRVRMGVDDIDVFEKQLAATTRGNGTRFYSGQWFFWIHGSGDTIWINESLLQSYTGEIRLAPVKRKMAARFGRLRAVGAFLVSGEIRAGGELAYAAIESEAGVTCKLIRPWAGAVRVREVASMRSVEVKEAGEILEFATTRGATYIVDRPGEPWEANPIVTIP